MKNAPLIPTDEVLNAFGIAGKPTLIEGGEGTSYLVGDVVLKPISSEAEAIWRAELLSNLPQVGFRIAEPLKTRGGLWVFDGWEAVTFLEGKPSKKRWKEKIAVSRKFHAQLKGVSRPTFIDSTNHPWAVSDRMVWGEQKLVYSDRLKQVMEQLEAMVKPISLQNQLIHGDMTGNILFHENVEPAVIDLSPYWRPSEFATAIIILDSLVWDGADESLLDEMENTVEMNQLLVRAALWRIKTTEEYIRQYGKGSIDDVDAYKPFIEMMKLRCSYA